MLNVFLSPAIGIVREEFFVEEDSRPQVRDITGLALLSAGINSFLFFVDHSLDEVSGHAFVAVLAVGTLLTVFRAGGTFSGGSVVISLEAFKAVGRGVSLAEHTNTLFVEGSALNAFCPFFKVTLRASCVHFFQRFAFFSIFVVNLG